jgi:hypothetical protein
MECDFNLLYYELLKFPFLNLFKKTFKHLKMIFLYVL